MKRHKNQESIAAPQSPKPGRRTTSYDVALAAGVSQSAVSRCFAPGGVIAPATRAKIVKVALEMGYRPNALARGLILGRSNLIAVMISNQTNLYYPEMLAELSRCLMERDMRMLLFSLCEESEVDSVLDQVLGHRVDGVISAARLSEAQIRRFDEHGVPLVLFNRLSRSAASVSCDPSAGGRALIEALLATGHRRFAIVAGPAYSSLAEERQIAALQFLKEAGIDEVPVIRGTFSYESGRQALHTIMEDQPRVEAVVCVNDLMAIGAIDAARFELGLNVPRDVSIVGFDGSDPANWLSYRLTSIRQPLQRMTSAAVSMLLERVDDHALPVEARLFAGELLRGTSARLP